jgi:hypothetical protein
VINKGKIYKGNCLFKLKMTIKKGFGGLVRNLVLGAAMGLGAGMGLGLLFSSKSETELSIDGNQPKVEIKKLSDENKQSAIAIVHDYFKNGSVCGGVHIGDNKILAATHCLDDRIIFATPMTNNFVDNKAIDFACNPNSVRNFFPDVSVVECHNYAKYNSTVNIGNTPKENDLVYICPPGRVDLDDLIDQGKKYFGEDVFKVVINDRECIAGRVGDVNFQKIFLNIPIRQGYSGSGVFNFDGEVVAIVSKVYDESGIYRCPSGLFDCGKNSIAIPVSFLRDE